MRLIIIAHRDEFVHLREAFGDRAVMVPVGKDFAAALQRLRDHDDGVLITAPRQLDHGINIPRPAVALFTERTRGGPLSVQARSRLHRLGEEHGTATHEFIMKSAPVHEGSEWRGPLHYLGWEHPWMLGPYDVHPMVMDALRAASRERGGERVRMGVGPGNLTLRVDLSSEYVLSWPDDATVPLVEKREAFGFRNLMAYVDITMQRLGRNVRLSSGRDRPLRVAPMVPNDPSVPAIAMRENSNVGPPTDAQVENVCRVGTPDCCAFLTASGSGFQCAKFDSSTCRSTLHRVATGDMRATRIGACRPLRPDFPERDVHDQPVLTEEKQ